MPVDRQVSLARVSRAIVDAMGLHFPQERWPDLQRGLTGAAQEFGFATVAECVDWLMSAPLTPAQLQVLAAHLTIGETYFFREKKTFAVFREQVLPQLIASRRGRDQRLRVWSAACCTGEEAYSLAILLHELLPDLEDWQVTILATDVNGRFLRKAVAGSYGEWSFRDAPAGFRERYFRKNEERRHAIIPEIREMVTFAHLNLVDDVYPSLETNTNAMDVIFCRNVLMYFPHDRIRSVSGKLYQSVVDGGWLAVSPSEASQALFPQFATRNYPGVILYQKGGRQDETAGPATSQLREPTKMGATPSNAPATFAPRAHAPASSENFSLLARARANDGQLDDARTLCERWIVVDKMNCAAHYLRAVVLLEQGSPDDARGSLQRAIYLQPDFVLAHFALGNLARGRGKRSEADRHFRNALALLSRYGAGDVLPESDGLTAGRLTETIAALVASEPAR